MEEYKASIPDWAWALNCAITVCDSDCTIIYMNRRSRETFSGRGELIGKNLLDCHNPHSVEIIRRLLAEGGQNCYTIEKHGVHKMIFQTAWHRADGTIGGLVELSMIIPETMPHYVRN